MTDNPKLAVCKCDGFEYGMSGSKVFADCESFMEIRGFREFRAELRQELDQVSNQGEDDGAKFPYLR